MIWQLNSFEKKINVLHIFKISPQRRIHDITLINSLPDHEEKLGKKMRKTMSMVPVQKKASDRILVIYDQASSEEKTRAGEEADTEGPVFCGWSNRPAPGLAYAGSEIP